MYSEKLEPAKGFNLLTLVVNNCKFKDVETDSRRIRVGAVAALKRHRVDLLITNIFPEFFKEKFIFKR